MVNGQDNFTLSPGDADKIQAVVCAAIVGGKITLAEATEIACLALPQLDR